MLFSQEDAKIFKIKRRNFINDIKVDELELDDKRQKYKGRKTEERKNPAGESLETTQLEQAHVSNLNLN